MFDGFSIWVEFLKVRELMWQSSGLFVKFRLKYTKPETNSQIAPERRPFATKGNHRIPTVMFKVHAISFREGNNDNNYPL